MRFKTPKTKKPGLVWPSSKKSQMSSRRKFSQFRRKPSANSGRRRISTSTRRCQRSGITCSNRVTRNPTTNTRVEKARKVRRSRKDQRMLPICLRLKNRKNKLPRKKRRRAKCWPTIRRKWATIIWLQKKKPARVVANPKRTVRLPLRSPRLTLRPCKRCKRTWQRIAWAARFLDRPSRAKTIAQTKTRTLRKERL